MTSLDPLFSIGDQVTESIKVHRKMRHREALDRVVEMLQMVGIPSPERRIKDYPHQLSGGMRQRVMIGMAMACDPKLILADEPTTALDVTIQAQIFDLMIKLKERTGTSIILITHDMGVIAEMAKRVTVMYAGDMMERADVKDLFSNPLHPYTIGLLESIPGPDKTRLKTIPGIVPNLLDLPPGCPFSNRCPKAQSICFHQKPPLVAPHEMEGHLVRCWLYTSILDDENRDERSAG
jgi:oligopeptide/dipeptide ABC transporter ATP-binding protein